MKTCEFAERKAIIIAPNGETFMRVYCSWKELFVILGENSCTHLNSLDSLRFIQYCIKTFKHTCFRVSRVYFKHDEYKVTKIRRDDIFKDPIEVTDIVDWLNKHKKDICITDSSNFEVLMQLDSAVYMEADKKLLIRATRLQR